MKSYSSKKMRPQKSQLQLYKQKYVDHSQEGYSMSTTYANGAQSSQIDIQSNDSNLLNVGKRNKDPQKTSKFNLTQPATRSQLYQNQKVEVVKSVFNINDSPEIDEESELRIEDDQPQVQQIKCVPLKREEIKNIQNSSISKAKSNINIQQQNSEQNNLSNKRQKKNNSCQENSNNINNNGTFQQNNFDFYDKEQAQQLSDLRNLDLSQLLHLSQLPGQFSHRSPLPKKNIKKVNSQTKSFSKQQRKSPLHIYRNSKKISPNGLGQPRSSIDQQSQFTSFEHFNKINVKSPDSSVLALSQASQYKKVMQIQQNGSIMNQIKKRNSLLMSMDAVLFKKEQKPQKNSICKSPTQFSVYQRLQQNSEDWNKNRNQWQEPQKEDEEIKSNCTFQPEIKKSPNRFINQKFEFSRKRSIDQFLSDQAQKQLEKESFLSQKREEALRNEFGGYISQSKSSENFRSITQEQEERNKKLDSKKEEKMKLLEKEVLADYTFKPTLSQKSLTLINKEKTNKNVVERLFIKQKVNAVDEKQVQHEKLTNDCSINLICKRLHKDLQNAYINCNIETEINKEQFLLLVHELGYYQKNQQYENEKQLNLIWELLTNSKEFISLSNLKTFLTGIEGAEFQWMIKNDIEQQDQNIGIFINDVFYFKNALEIQNVHKKYFTLVFNRRRYLEQSQLRLSQLKNEEIHKFDNKKQDLMCKKSKELVNQNSNNIERGEILMQKGVYYRQKIQEIQQKQEQQKLASYSFQPLTNETYISVEEGKIVKKQSRSPYQSKEERLSNLSKNFSSKTLLQKTTNEIEYSQQQNECTFKPVINQKTYKNIASTYSFQSKSSAISPIRSPDTRSQVTSPRSKPTTMIHQYKESQENIKIKDKIFNHSLKQSASLSLISSKQITSQVVKQSLPKQKSQSKIINQKAQSKSLNQSYLDQQSQQDSKFYEQNKINDQQTVQSGIPILFLDVNLGRNKAQRIIIHEGENVDQIINDFSTMFHLSSKKKNKLMNVIRQQLSSHLHCIEEED